MDIRCTGLKGLLRSLLRFLSYSAQVTGQFLIYLGTYMLRVLDDKEERPSLRSQAKGRFTCGYPYDVPDYAGYPYDVPDYAGSYPYDVPDYA
nr:CIDEA (del 160-219 aa)-3XHA [synthetic construct]